MLTPFPSNGISFLSPTAATALLALTLAASSPALAAEAPCDVEQLQSEISKIEAKFDRNELSRKAEGSAQFKEKTKGHTSEFNSLQAIWRFDPATCKGLALEEVNAPCAGQAKRKLPRTFSAISVPQCRLLQGIPSRSHGIETPYRRSPAQTTSVTLQRGPRIGQARA